MSASWPVKDAFKVSSARFRSSLLISGSMSLACNKPSRILAMSLGPPRSSESRESARSKSGTAFNTSRKARISFGLLSMRSMRLWRFSITSSCNEGADSRCSSNRPPAAVTVQSIVASKDPARLPDSAWVISRLRRVAASICITFELASRTGGRNIGSRPFCVISKYSIIAPKAEVSARPKFPNASKAPTSKRDLMRFSAAALSKAAAPSDVVGTPASSNICDNSSCTELDKITSLGCSLASSGPN